MDIEILAYIHSNKFITTKLFHKKFHPGHSYVTAWTHLKGLVEKGWLLKTQKLPNDDTYFYLSRSSLHQLSSLAQILISPEVRSPHINLNEREHDKRILEMRVHIEGDPALSGLVWLSDYEMRCGLRLDWKKALAEGRGWALAGAKLHRVHQRTPDGYFETEIEGKGFAFVLEYEHSPYNREKMAAMAQNLLRDFPRAYRLIVSRSKEQAIRLAQGMEACLKGDPRNQGLWAFSFYEKVVNLPFTRTPWATLEDGYLPFVKDPILKATTRPEEVNP